MKRLLKEPLLHFFILGAAVFGLFEIFDNTPPPVDVRAITVTEDTVRRLTAEFEATWRRKPNVDEIDRLIEHFVNEEVYVREAKALGLDRDDAIVRRRLQMKMEFLTEAGAQSVNPDDATLEAHLAAHSERFSRAAFLAFEQIYLGDSIEAARAEEITARLNAGADPNSFGERSLLPNALHQSPARVVDGTFGTGFFDRLMDLPEGEWTGPLPTTFGQHLVRVTNKTASTLPPLEDIRDAVLLDWRANLTKQLREERLKAMRARYEIVRLDAIGAIGK